MDGAAAEGVRVRVKAVRWGEESLFWSNEFPKFDLDLIYDLNWTLIFVLGHTVPVNFGTCFKEPTQRFQVSDCPRPRLSTAAAIALPRLHQSPTSHPQRRKHTLIEFHRHPFAFAQASRARTYKTCQTPRA